MRILHVVSTLSRAGGGISVAVSEWCGHLAASGVEVLLLTREEAEEELVSIPPGVDLAAVPGGKLLGGPFLRRVEAEHAGKPFALVHQHGLWTPAARAAARFARRHELPTVLSPHGMLEPWALEHHARRKKAAMRLYQRRDLEAAAVLHATAESEAEQFRRLGFGQPVAILPIGVELRPPRPASRRENRVALTLSRIDPKKNLAALLNAWSAVRPEGWKLVVAGAGDPVLTEQLKRQARRLGLAETVEFPGAVFGAEKGAAFERADLFVLPSFSENFGIVVAEAMSHGLPVIATTGTPWRLLAEKHAGWWVAPEA
ncbi:MAG: glycosyltransferase, partial [Verrucomicrobiae bacterium]|nr:glycosyltransferase [Verrucomicrobiae bacterium]